MIYPAMTAMATPPRMPRSCARKETPPRPPNICAPKMPQASPPHTPASPCNGHTPSTSSIFQRDWVRENATTNNTPATAPIINPPTGCTTSEPAQMATNPARAPLWMNPGSFLPAMSAPSTPPTIAINELIATSPVILSKLWALMTLNPNQPTTRIHEPNARKGIFDGGICWDILPSLV